MLNQFSKILLVSSCLVMVSCTTTARMGQLTIASTHNVRNLNYDTSSNSKVEGEACLKNLLGLFTWGEKEDYLQISMDDAIKNGQDNGIDGDLLVNARITDDFNNYFFYFSRCLVVTGDLVKLKI